MHLHIITIYSLCMVLVRNTDPGIYGFRFCFPATSVADEKCKVQIIYM